MRLPFTSIHSPLLLLYVLLIFSALSPPGLAANPQVSQDEVAASPAIDPNKGPSELNHHIAGMFLIAIGLCVIGSERYQSLSWLRWLPPILFIAAGLFLAAWSDDEIWPRGTLSWSWLLHHDAEARQHKLYALLLIALGSIEIMRLLPKLQRPWLKVVFPILCAIGGISLVFHSHGGEIAVTAATQPAPVPPDKNPHHHPAALSPMSTPGHEHHSGGAPRALPPSESIAAATTFHSHEHALTGSAAKIRTEHAWFAVVGFWVALFKFLYDYARRPARVARYLWANSLILLGFLLLLYTE